MSASQNKHDDEKQLQLSYEVAAVVEQLDEIIGNLTDEHIATLDRAIEGIHRDMAQYNALGIMFEPETAEAREMLAKQALMRMEAIKTWRTGMKLRDDGQMEALNAKIAHAELKKAIGL